MTGEPTLVPLDASISPAELEAFHQLCARFAGVSIDYRRWGVDWPAPWRVRVFSSKHEGARVEAYGNGAGQAIALANARLAEAMPPIQIGRRT